MKPIHALGQVFLKDKNYQQKIIDTLHIDGEHVVEIGAGQGQMSTLLQQKAKHLDLIELDTRFQPILQEKFKDTPNITIHHADILKFRLNTFESPVIIFGNAPYQISNELIRYLVTNRSYIKRVYLTLQKEFVDKLIAQPSTKPYGFLSCFIQYYANVTKHFNIPARAFSPIPKIDSAFMEIEFYTQSPYPPCDETRLFKLIRRAFTQRRKKITNSLNIPSEKLQALGINPNCRAENLSIEDFIKIVA